MNEAVAVTIQPASIKAGALAPSKRVTVIDMLRGVAMVLMALDHSASFANVNLTAESYAGVRPTLGQLPNILVGLVTNLASGIFFTLTGVSVAFFERSRRKNGWTEWQICRFFLIRAATLLVLDQFLTHYAWQDAPKFDVLSAVGFSLIVLAFARLIPLRVLAVITVLLFLGYPLLVQAFPYDPGQPLSGVSAIMLHYVDSASEFPHVEFPALGRLSLVLFGYICGRLLQEGKLVISPRLLWVALAGILASVVLRLLGGYGNFLPYQAGWPNIYWLIENKEPPSIVYLLFNLSCALVVLVVLQQVEKQIERHVGRFLLILGQTSLFFYAAHLMVYGRIVRHIFPNTFLAGSLARGFLEFGIGLLIVFPLCVLYRDLRRNHPNSILRYF